VTHNLCLFRSGNCGAHALCVIEWIMAKHRILQFRDEEMHEIRKRITVEVFVNSMDPI